MKGGFFLCDDPPLLLAELGGEGERHEGMIEEFFHYKKKLLYQSYLEYHNG
jgi:hypothetical protein